MESVIQALPAFRDSYVGGGVPPERVVVIDEAQRCWSAAHAIAKTATRLTKLHQSEPAHLLDIMQQREDGAAIICLVGSGQEIHDGEGGLAEWGEALRTRPAWRVLASADALAAPMPRQRLPALPGLACQPSPASCGAGPLAALCSSTRLGGCNARRGRRPGPPPRPAAACRSPLPGTSPRCGRGCGMPAAAGRRAGLLASSGARRLRAEGLGGTLPHDDPAAVARWFLDRFPDIRASDALEVAATEFFAQGLELDAAGLCWDGDLVRGETGWCARHFRGTAWTRPRAAEKTMNRLNAYRVLLTHPGAL